MTSASPYEEMSSSDEDATYGFSRPAISSTSAKSSPGPTVFPSSITFSLPVEHQGGDTPTEPLQGEGEDPSLLLRLSAKRIKKILSRGTRAQVAEFRRSQLPFEAINTYAKLFDDVEKDVHSKTDKTEDDGRRYAEKSGKYKGVSYHTRVQTQNGIVTWTREEKDMFYRMLSRKGKSRVAEIADAIGSKSKLEVADYLRLLHRGLRWQHLRGRGPVHGAVMLGDIPAAAEISQECCEALDEYAAVLRFRDHYDEDVPGKQKHKDMWIVTGANAERIEEGVGVEETSPDKSHHIVYLPATLLKMSQWIYLSERFFMNAGQARRDDNWVNLSHFDESPAMTAEAFADFYSLTVSITRRLVQSALFMAMSRIHNNKIFNRAPLVRVRDVSAALEVMNMEHGHVEFWPGLARRCSLDVADYGDRRKGFKPRYVDYEEVEHLLSKEGRMHRWRTSENAEEEEDQEEEEDDDDDDDDDDGDGDYSENSIDQVEEEEDNDSSSSLLTDSETSNPEERQALEKDRKEFKDEYNRAIAIDRDTSRAEEQQLWALMRKNPKGKQPLQEEGEEEEEEAEAARPLRAKRKTAQDLVDWRDSIHLYQSEWETYGHDLIGVNDEIRERKRRCVELSSEEEEIDQDEMREDVTDDEEESASASDMNVDVGDTTQGAQDTAQELVHSRQ